jgi:hypothetical protein
MGELVQGIRHAVFANSGEEQKQIGQVALVQLDVQAACLIKRAFDLIFFYQADDPF